MENSIKFHISKDMAFTVPYRVFFIFSVISLISTLAVIWYILYLNMAYFLILLLPAYFANVVAFLSSRMKFLKSLERSIDFNFNWIDGKRIFGDSKTFRGLLSGIVTAILTSYIVYTILTDDAVYSSVEEVLILGFLAGFGAMAGDLIRSFFKRRIGLRTGETWFLFDDLDFIIGALLFLGIYIEFPTNFIMLTLVGTLTLRILSNSFDFAFKLKQFY